MHSVVINSIHLNLIATNEHICPGKENSVTAQYIA